MYRVVACGAHIPQAWSVVSRRAHNPLTMFHSHHDVPTCPFCTIPGRHHGTRYISTSLSPPRPRPPNVFQIKVTVFLQIKVTVFLLSLGVERARGSWRRVGSVESWKRRTEATAEKWEETRHQGRTGGLRRGWGSWRAGSLEVSPIHQVLDSWTRHFCPLLFFHLLAVPGTYSATSACVPNSATMLVSCCDEMNPSRRNTMEDVHVCLRPGTWGAPDPSASFIG